MLAYVEPDIRTFYKERQLDGQPPSTKVVPKFKGLSGKFINMSNQKVRMYYEATPKSTNPLLMNYVAPMEAAGTATFDRHVFFFATEHGDPLDQSNVLIRWNIKGFPNNIYTYDPYKDIDVWDKNSQVDLSDEEKYLYQKIKDTLKFNDLYLHFTGRTYLANYLRTRPMYYMWRADYFDQTHWVTTYETHFTSLPPENKLEEIKTYGEERLLNKKSYSSWYSSSSSKANNRRLLSEYRKPGDTMNMTLKVLSVAPRVFEIPNFLSTVEIDHILMIAGNITLQRSSVGDIQKGETKTVDKKSTTRTSFNSWVKREKSPVIDSIYRRAADLMKIDEAYMRYRDHESEINDVIETRNSIAEDLQLVHYDEGQEYTSHHDFGYSNVKDEKQGTRFATLLLYLNGDELIGGETKFPRYANAETFHGLEVPPKAGNAVLFYSQLPDGNLDDFSQHAARRVLGGEKWLINLWVWDKSRE